MTRSAQHHVIGLISDSHNHLSLMTAAIDFLRKRGATRMVHLGDICDSLHPEFLERAVEILERERVEAVRGNNECAVMTEFAVSHPDQLSLPTRVFLENLPYMIRSEAVVYAHSAPFEWPEATRRPLRYYLPRMMANGSLPFGILFRGHSHRCSVLEICGDKIEKLPVKPGVSIDLDKNKHYIITVGAIERGACALFDSDAYRFSPLDLSFA